MSVQPPKLINCTGLDVKIFDDKKENVIATIPMGRTRSTKAEIARIEHIFEDAYRDISDGTSKKSFSVNEKKIDVITGRKRKRDADQVISLPINNKRRYYSTTLEGRKPIGVEDPKDLTILVTENVALELLRQTEIGLCNGQWNGAVYTPDMGTGAVRDGEGHFIGTTRLIQYLGQGQAASAYRAKASRDWADWVADSNRRGLDPYR